MTLAISYSLLQADNNSKEAISAQLSAINDLCKASRWQFKQFQEALKQPSLLTFVVEQQSQIIGYAIFSIVSPEAHLVNIAIAPSYQQQGIGSSFFNYVLKQLRQMDVEECWLEVRESNLSARNFYQKAGFVDIQKRKDFYEQPKEDAWLMLAKIDKIVA